MITSAILQDFMLDYLNDGQEHSVNDMKNHLTTLNINNYTEGQFAGSLTTLLRNGSITKINRGIYAIKKKSESMKTCFVVSPTGNEGSEVRSNANKLFKYIIKPVCEACDIEPIRVDQLNDANSVTQTIIDNLETADLVIADVSGHNPNVFYEIGFRTRTKKPIIHLKTKSENLPFDINTIRTFEYDLTDLDSVEEVKSRLIQTVKSLNFSVSDDVDANNENVESAFTAVTPILYQILDAVSELRNDMKNNNTDTIATVVKAMQSAQPQVSNDTALQMQLISGLMQNPDGFMKLLEVSDKLSQPKPK